MFSHACEINHISFLHCFVLLASKFTISILLLISFYLEILRATHHAYIKCESFIQADALLGLLLQLLPERLLLLWSSNSPQAFLLTKGF